MQKVGIKGRQGDVQFAKITSAPLTSTGKLSIFAVAKAFSAVRRAQSCTEKTKAMPASPVKEKLPVSLMLPGKYPDKSPKNYLKLPVSPAGRGLTSGKLQLPACRSPSPTGVIFGGRTSRSMSPQGDLRRSPTKQVRTNPNASPSKNRKVTGSPSNFHGCAKDFLEVHGSKVTGAPKPDKTNLGSPNPEKVCISKIEKGQGSPASGLTLSPKVSQTKLLKSNASPNPAEKLRKQNTRPQKIDRDAFQHQRQGDIRSAYTWDEGEDELGRGGCGVVFLARDRNNPKRQVAVKRVLTHDKTEIQNLKDEIEMLRKLDHPNVLRLYESFEDGKTVYLVMELCTGGDLFERLQDDRHCTENYCSDVTAQICGALAHCHNQGICHRDLKPENLLLLSQADDAPIKVADFGLAKHIAPGNSSQMSYLTTCKERRKVVKRLRTFLGTLEYMAPEVIRTQDEKSGPTAYYDFRCDTWGMGVIAYMMLTGCWPFKLEQVAAYVAEDVPLPDLKLNLSGLSTHAQDFICQCLEPNFNKRPLPCDLLSHAFLDQKQMAKPSAQSITPMASRFSHFANLSAVKKAALTAAVRHLKGFEVEKVRAHFELFDVDRDGTISLKEFANALEKWPQLLPTDFVSTEDLFQTLDTDDSGHISYTEFIAATTDIKLEAREDLARKAFEAFDHKGDGEISGEDIRRVFGGKRQGTADLAEFGIKKGEAAHFERFQKHLHSQ